MPIRRSAISDFGRRYRAGITLVLRRYAAVGLLVAAVGVSFAIWSAERDRTLQAQMTGPVSEVFAVLAERCTDWISSRPKPGSIEGFRLHGLQYAVPENGWPVFKTSDEMLYLKLQPIDNRNVSCTISDEKEPWPMAERELIEAHTVDMAPDFLSSGFISVDLREKTGFALHHVYRPSGDYGKFVMLVRTVRDRGQIYNFVTIGRAEFVQGGENA